MIIIGAGLAGCIAAHLMPQAIIYESLNMPDLIKSHKAVLRFRSDAVSNVTGIPFREVTVRKGIFYRGNFHQPSINLANMYSQKVVGRITDRSIWNIDTVTRWVAPENLHSQMIDQLGERVELGKEVDIEYLKEARVPVVSTIPMYGLSSFFQDANFDVEFNYKKIHVIRATIANCDVHQTVYFPDPTLAFYRVSITGSELIAEYMPDDNSDSANTRLLESILRNVFGLDVKLDQLSLQETSQRHGKISEIDEKKRRKFIHYMTTNHGVYSLGRFATWRNILLDDIVKDAKQIKKMIELDQYERRLI